MHALSPIEQAAGLYVTLATTAPDNPAHWDALARLGDLGLTEADYRAAAIMGRDWFALAGRIAAALDTTDCCPDCGHTSDRTTPCLCPGRDHGPVADTLPY